MDQTAKKTHAQEFLVGAPPPRTASGSPRGNVASGGQPGDLQARRMGRVQDYLGASLEREDPCRPRWGRSTPA